MVYYMGLAWQSVSAPILNSPKTPCVQVDWTSKSSLHQEWGMKQRTEDGTLKGVTRAFAPNWQMLLVAHTANDKSYQKKGVLICLYLLIVIHIHPSPMFCWEFACIQSSYLIFFALHGNRAQLKKYIITRSVKYNIVFPPYIKACTFWSSKIAQTTYCFHGSGMSSLTKERKICNQRNSALNYSVHYFKYFQSVEVIHVTDHFKTRFICT